MPQKHLNMDMLRFRDFLLPINTNFFLFSVATCNYVRYGRGGGQEVKNAICILSLNIINDKVFPCLYSDC